MGRMGWPRHIRGSRVGAPATEGQAREVLELRLSKVSHAELLEAARRSNLSLAEFVEQALVVAEWLTEECGKGSELWLRSRTGDEKPVSVGLLASGGEQAAV